MRSINTAFTQTFLRLIMKQVRQHTTPEQRKKTWVYKLNDDHFEFHGPEDFYWHGTAGDKYDARAKGWSAWLSAKGIGIEDEEEWDCPVDFRDARGL